MKAVLASKTGTAAALRACVEAVFAGQAGEPVGRQSGGAAGYSLCESSMLSAISELRIGQRVILPICAATAVYLIYKLVIYIKQKNEADNDE